MLVTNRTYDLFDEMFNDPFFRRSYDYEQPVTTQIMKADIHENDKGYILDIELPGYRKEDVKAELQDGYLTITASRSEEKDPKGEGYKYIRKERYTGTCKRSFYVGEELRQEDIKAAFQDGILRLAIPKKVVREQEDHPAMIPID